MTKHDLNVTPIIDLESFNQPTKFPEVTFKNMRFEKAIESTSSYCVDILSKMRCHIKHPLKFQYVDIKVHHLKPNKNPANGRWHLDSSLNPIHHYENYLFVSGVSALTEFIIDPLSIDTQESGYGFDKTIQNINGFRTRRVESCTITKFGGDNVHRSVKATQEESRLLIRLINTDRILPSYMI